MASQTKRCKGCGWEYPMSSPLHKCRFCGTVFTEGLCGRCGKYSDKLRKCGRLVCPDCMKLCVKEWYDGQSKQAEDALKDWMSLVNKIPTGYHTLTNAEWLEACAFFDGCAMCDNPHINTRGFFLPFKTGGRYSRWNVIPLCEDCAKKYGNYTNPFRAFHKRLGQNRMSIDKAMEHYYNADRRLNKIVSYLRPRLEDAANDR